MLYTIEDKTLTAMGDIIRNYTIGQSELPTTSIEPTHIDYRYAYPNQLPSFVKKTKIIGSMVFRGRPGIYGLQGLGVASGVYTQSEKYQVRDAESYFVIKEYIPAKEITQEKIDSGYYDYDFEVVIDGNAWAFVVSVNSWSELSFDLSYTAIGLDENGNEFKYTPLEMIDEVNGIIEDFNNAPIIPEEAFNITGDCSYRFANNGWNWFIEAYGNKITTSNISEAKYMFANSDKLLNIPFEINTHTDSTSMSYMFSQCKSLEQLPKMNGVFLYDCGYMFDGCNNLRNIPEDYFNTWNFDRIQTTTTAAINCIFFQCNSLRKIPQYFLSNIWGKGTSNSYTPYPSMFTSCFVLDEIKDLGVHQGKLTSNRFSSTFDKCSRVKDITFAVNEDGTPKTAEWKSQTMDLSNQVGFNFVAAYLTTYHNSGIAEDKQVSNDATYQALKNDDDWFATEVNYSRYNHDSAVNTINSLPDCSATGTNTIKFKGEAGAKTDGGAINTLTEEEIAVAAAKGWTVSLV